MSKVYVCKKDYVAMRTVIEVVGAHIESLSPSDNTTELIKACDRLSDLAKKVKNANQWVKPCG